MTYHRPIGETCSNNQKSNQLPQPRHNKRSNVDSLTQQNLNAMSKLKRDLELVYLLKLSSNQLPKIQFIFLIKHYLLSKLIIFQKIYYFVAHGSKSKNKLKC